MFYRRLLSAAVGAACVVSGSAVVNKSCSSSSTPTKFTDHGLQNYTFMDCKRFELVNTTILVRHGARTPNWFVDTKYVMPDWECDICYVELLPDLTFPIVLKELPTNKTVSEESVQDEYLQHIQGRCIWGQLTLIGQQQALTFGKELKRIFIDEMKYLSEEFDTNEIFLRSTKFPRTFYTIKGIISGMYGVNSFNRCRIPVVYTMPITSDSMYPNPDLCPVIKAFNGKGSVEIAKDGDIMKMKCLLKGILGVKFLKFVDPNNSDKNKCEKNREKPGETDDAVPIYAIRDFLVSRQAHNFEVPAEYNSLYPEISRFSSQEVLYENLGGSQEWEDRISIIISPILNFIKVYLTSAVNEVLASQKTCVPDMKDTVMKGNKLKMQIFSCHDTSLIPILVALRIYDGQWPHFMSNLFVELYKEISTNNLFVRVLYCGQVQKLKLSDKSCGGSSEHEAMGLYPYKDFAAFIEKYSFGDDCYVSSCDRAMRLFTSGKPVVKNQYANGN